RTEFRSRACPTVNTSSRPPPTSSTGIPSRPIYPTAAPFSGRIPNPRTSLNDFIAPSRRDDRPEAVPTTQPLATLPMNLSVLPASYVFSGVHPSSGAETQGKPVAFGQSDPLERADVAAAEDGCTPLSTYPASCRQIDRRKALPARWRQHVGGTVSLVRGSLSQFNGIKFVEVTHESIDGGVGAGTGQQPHGRSIRNRNWLLAHRLCQSARTWSRRVPRRFSRGIRCWFLGTDRAAHPM